MNAFSRRGTCPALSAPMPTGDGLLVRLNPAAGGLSPKALIGLCDAAARHGNGIVEVTARGSLQVRGLTAGSAPLLAAEVDRLGIAVRTGVPVETGPLAGLDPAETADPRALAERIRGAIGKTDLAERLGPKVSVVLDGGGRFSMDAVHADVRLTALASGGWLLAIAGDADTAKPIDTIAEADACEAVLAILNAIAERGREARARDLDPGSLPLRLRVEIRDGDNPQSPSPPSPARQVDSPPRRERKIPLGAFPLSSAGHALIVGLPFGSVPAGRLAALATVAEQLGTMEMRPALQRSLILIGLLDVACQPLLMEARRLGFLTDPLDPRRMIAACPGWPACASGQLETRDIAEAAASTASGLLDGSFTLHVSGCAKGCAHPGAAQLTLVGGDNGAGLVVGGTAKSLPRGYTPRYDAARGVARLATLVESERLAGESAAACVARMGTERITQAFVQE